MAAAAAGIDVSRKTPDIRPGGRDGTATSDTDGFRKVARLPGRGRRRGPSRRPRGGCTGPSCSPCTTGASRSSWRPRASPGTSPGPAASWRRPTGPARACRPPCAPRSRTWRPRRRRTGPSTGSATCRSCARRPSTGAPGRGGPGPGRRSGRGRARPGGPRRDRRRRRRVRPADRGARRGVGGPGGELRHPAPVPGIGPVTAASPVARAGRAPSAAAGPPPWPASPPSPATAAPSGAGATSPAGGGVRGTSPAWRRRRPACPIPTRRRCKAGQGQGGRARKVAVTAVMRKLVVTANVLLRDRRRREDRSAPAA